jgi:multidrug efflux pump subunit AcrA (membrane-fusion protein)
MQSNTELSIIEQPELLQVVKSSKLDINKAELYAAGYAPLMNEVTEQNNIIKALNKLNPEDAVKAKRASLDLGKIISRATDKKKEDKELLLLETKHIDNLFNLVESVGRLGQADAKEIFTYAEKVEAERVLKLEGERKLLLAPYGELNAYVDLKAMDAETFEKYLSNEKLAYETRLEQAKEAELKRIADEEQAEADRLEAEQEAELERIRIETEAKAERDRILKENEALRIASEKRENEIKEQNRLAKIEQDKKNAALELANEKAAKLQAERDRLAKIESDKQAKIQAELKAENDRIAAELKAKVEAEEKAQEEEKARILAENSERISREKAARLAPEREKVKVFFGEFEKLKFPELTSEQGIAMAGRVNEALLIVRKLIISDSKNLL